MTDVLVYLRLFFKHGRFRKLKHYIVSLTSNTTVLANPNQTVTGQLVCRENFQPLRRIALFYYWAVFSSSSTSTGSSKFLVKIFGINIVIFHFFCVYFFFLFFKPLPHYFSRVIAAGAHGK